MKRIIPEDTSMNVYIDMSVSSGVVEKLKIAIDTYYFSDTEAKTVGVIFKDWKDQAPLEVVSCWSSEFGPYIPGQFYKRELPCIMDLIRQIPDFSKRFDTIIIDALARLPLTDEELKSPEHGGRLVDGLGIRLEEALIKEGYFCPDATDIDKWIGIIGVAKTKWLNIDLPNGLTKAAISRVWRGKSKSPLYVNTNFYKYSSMEAAMCIKNMYGENRIPDLLKILDKETKKR